MEALRETEPKGRIAVIDDDAIFVDLMQDLLADGEGYDVVSAPNWVQSLEFVKQVQPDLIILDLMLGSAQTGWGVLELLREDPATATIPVILCSAAAPALRQLGGVDQLPGRVVAVAKPFDVDDMIEVVQRLLKQAHRSIA